MRIRASAPTQSRGRIVHLVVDTSGSGRIIGVFDDPGRARRSRG